MSTSVGQQEFVTENVCETHRIVNAARDRAFELSSDFSATTRFLHIVSLYAKVNHDDEGHLLCKDCGERF